MSAPSSSNNNGRFKKEKVFRAIKDYYLKISLTGDNKILFRCYDLKKLDCTCFQLIKSKEEIFDLYEEMSM